MPRQPPPTLHLKPPSKVPAMPAAPLDTPVCDAARAVLERHPAIDAAYMLGSAAAGRLRPDSDVDIAVLPRPGHMLSVPDRLALGVELSSIFLTDLSQMVIM